MAGCLRSANIPALRRGDKPDHAGRFFTLFSPKRNVWQEKTGQPKALDILGRCLYKKIIEMDFLSLVVLRYSSIVSYRPSDN
jgi:hypothetical protein